MQPAKVAKHRTALPAKELPAFVEALDAYNGDLVTKLAMRLVLLTFVRTSVIRFARWSEFEGLNSLEPLSRIPADRMKMRRDHLVPLRALYQGGSTDLVTTSWTFFSMADGFLIRPSQLDIQQFNISISKAVGYLRLPFSCPPISSPF